MNRVSPFLATAWAQEAMTGIFLSVALLVPVVASAVSLSVYESARSDPARHVQNFMKLIQQRFLRQ